MIFIGLFGFYLIGNSDILLGVKLLLFIIGLILFSFCIIVLLIFFEKILKELLGV